MAELTPLYMDISNVYSGDDLGLPWRDVIGEGVVGSADLAVSQNGAGADLSVDIAAGAAWVLGDTNPDAQPCYRVRNDAVVNLGISPDASNPRKVLVVAQITDETFFGTGRVWTLDAIHGAPAPSPAEPALPDSALKLAVITVPAGAASIVNANIADARVRAAIGGGGVATSISAQRTTAISGVTGTTFAAGVDLLTSDLEFEADGVSDYEVTITALAWWNNTASKQNSLSLKLDGSDAGTIASFVEPIANGVAPLNVRGVVVAPSAGRHAINARFFVNGGSASMSGGVGGAGVSTPILVTVRRLS